MLGVPTMLVAMMEHPSFASADLSSVKAICSGGSTVPAAIVTALEQQLGAPFTIVFGQTECSPVASDDLGHRHHRRQGRDHRHADAQRRGQDRRPGHRTRPCRSARSASSARAAITSCSATSRYEAATAAAIDADGWLHTGDLGAMDARGYCTVEGRLKDMIIRGGENIYPRELEELLFSHPKVGDVAVVGLPDDKWGEVVAAFIRPRARRNRSTRTNCSPTCASISPRTRPRRHWFVVDAFPLTGSGKIQKFKLREPGSKGEMMEL